MSDDLNSRLSRLDSAPDARWRDVRAVARRRRAAWYGAASVAVVATLVAVVLPRLGGTSGSPAPSVPVAAGLATGDRVGAAVQLVAKVSPLTSSDPADVSAVATAEQDFTVRVLQQVVGSQDNVSTSPASLALALAMLQNGASGQTLAEISAALGTPVDEANSGWAGLSASLAAAARSAGIDFSSANSLWQQRGLALKAAFVSALTRYYDSGVWQVDFEHDTDGALAALNQWTSQHTQGKITKLFDSLDPSTLLVLANAVYFKAKWQTPFDATETKPGAFTGPDGSSSTVDYMKSPGMLATSSTSAYQAAQIPYQGGRFAATLIMPTAGSLTDFVASLTGAKLAAITSSLSTQALVSVPRFTTTSTLDLLQPLANLGIKQAMTDRADFSGISSTPVELGQAVQRVYLKVGEKGTEAAAVTGLGFVATALPAQPPVTFDHPFLFLVRDTTTGTVLFASAIGHPDPSS